MHRQVGTAEPGKAEAFRISGNGFSYRMERLMQLPHCDSPYSYEFVVDASTEIGYEIRWPTKIQCIEGRLLSPTEFLDGPKTLKRWRS